MAATDAHGQVTTLDYTDTDALNITKVTDPFGRFATFTYERAGRLQSSADVLGLQASFTYGTADIVKTLTTPYGTTTFTTSEKGITRWPNLRIRSGARNACSTGSASPTAIRLR